MERANMEGMEGEVQRFLRCVLRSWSWPCGPLGGARGRAGGGEGAHKGGALMSHSTGGGVGEGARRHLP